MSPRERCDEIIRVIDETLGEQPRSPADTPDPRAVGRSERQVARRGGGPPVRGDRIEVLIDTGAGVRTFELEATRAGRRLEVSVSRGMVEILEETRTGSPVRTARFMANRVVALVEHPALDHGRAEPSAPVRAA